MGCLVSDELKGKMSVIIGGESSGAVSSLTDIVVVTHLVYIVVR